MIVCSDMLFAKTSHVHTHEPSLTPMVGYLLQLFIYDLIADSHEEAGDGDGPPVLDVRQLFLLLGNKRRSAYSQAFWDCLEPEHDVVQ